MKVKQIKQRGELVWLVDGKINGKRKRMFFAPERQPERWLKTEEEDTTCQNWWLNLSNGDQVDMMNAFMRSRAEGFTLLSAVDDFTVTGRGKQLLKKQTLGEAIGTAGPDKRKKNWVGQPKATGFLASKTAADRRSPSAGFQGVLTVAAEQQPCVPALTYSTTLSK